MKTKTCPACSKVKRLTQFHRGGQAGYCKDCERDLHRARAAILEGDLRGVPSRALTYVATHARRGLIARASRPLLAAAGAFRAPAPSAARRAGLQRRRRRS